MKVRHVMRAALCAFVLLALPSVAQEEVDVPKNTRSFEAFSIIVERNIFDPARHAAPAGTDGTYEEQASETERLALRGVLLDGGEAVAFFDGTQPEFRGAVSRGEEIGGCGIVEIRTDGVDLAQGDRRIELAVGAALSKREEGEWESSSEPWEPAPSGDDVWLDDLLDEEPEADGESEKLLKRLKKRRRKESE